MLNNFINFFFITLVASKSFLVKLNENLSFNTLTNEQILFHMNEANNVKDTFNIENIFGFVMEYNLFPYHLYDYTFVDFIEENHQVSVNHPFNIFFNDIEETFFYTYNSYFKNYTFQSFPIWNLDRIDQREKYLNNKYYYRNSAGKDVNVFIVDTGIDILHPEFQGRASWGFNGADTIDTDCNGHGTHVAGTVGSKTYGIAKNVNMIAVKVLDCQGSGSYSSVIGGLNYVLSQHKASNKSSVVNMSLGGPKSEILNKILAKLTTEGVHVIVAAGNENSNACDTSPASEPSVMTVGATTQYDEFASFSNWGLCVNILAPGTQIKSTYKNGQISTLQGTSMSSPHIAGIYALILSENPDFSPELIKKLLTSRCTKNAISKLHSNTVNCLAYSLS